MPARKRGHAELEIDEPVRNNEPGLLQKLRNTWQLANVMQWIYLFGDEFKIDPDFDIEDLEEECLKPEPSDKLAEVGLCLLKNISSHRGLTPELFDEYTRRQYVVRNPEENPFGEDEQPRKFAHFDVFTKLRVLHRLTTWTMSNPDRFREKMSKHGSFEEQVKWRISEFGWDSEDRPHYVLDDSRLYRRTPKPIPPPEPPKSKAKAKPKTKTPFRPRPKGARTSKRRRLNTSEEPEEAEEPEDSSILEGAEEVVDDDDGLGGDKWECICVTLEDYENFTQQLRKSRDPNERDMCKRLVADVLPTVREIEDGRAKKIAKRERELLTLEKLASAKRSSRIASRVEKEKEETALREVEEKRRKDLAAARKDAERQREMKDARMSRTMTREQRLKDREYKRILHEEELKRMEEEKEKIEKGEIDSKKSARHLQAEMRRAQEALEELNGEDEWVFDCSGCGVYGQNIDDGKHSIACERCNVWQHSACLNLSQEEAEKDDFHFVCQDCKRKEEEARQREEDAKKPKLPPLKFKIGGSSSPPQVKKEAPVNPTSPNGSVKLIMVDPSKKQKRKRKSSDLGPPGAVMPPEKVFKSYMPKQPVQSPSGQSLQHNGVSSSQPAVQTPEAAPSTGSGHSQQTSGISSGQPQINGYSTNAPKNSHMKAQEPPPGAQRPAHQQTGSMPRTPVQYQRQPPAASTTNDRTVASNSFGISSQTKIPPMPPPYTTPVSSFAANSPNNSFNSQAPAPSTPAHPLVPQKQPSAAPSPAPSTSLQASSPAIAPPAKLDASFSGISPVKNSSPPQPKSKPSSSSGNSALQGTPVVPPAQKLVPSPEAPSMNGVIYTAAQVGVVEGPDKSQNVSDSVNAPSQSGGNSS